MAGFKVLKRVNRFAAIASSVRHDAEKLEADVASDGEFYLKAITPRRTGRLADAWEAVPQPKGWAVKNPTPYRDYVNDGTIYIEGRHFIEEGLEFMRARFDAGMKRLLASAR